MESRNHQLNEFGRYIPMKQWRHEMAAKLGIAPTSVAGRIHKGQLTVPQTIRINKRVVFVYDIAT